MQCCQLPRLTPTLLVSSHAANLNLSQVADTLDVQSCNLKTQDEEQGVQGQGNVNKRQLMAADSNTDPNVKQQDGCALPQ